MSVTGKDYVDMIAKGVETFVRDHIREELVNKLVGEFEKEIQSRVNEILSEMVFHGESYYNAPQARKDLHLLIQWAKTKPEYIEKYSIQSEIVEK